MSMRAELVPVVDSVPQSTSLTAPNWTAEDLDALKQTIGAKLTNAEFRVFLAAARRLGLDPFAKQIYALKLEDRMTPQVAIDGLRLVAERTGRYAGQLGPYWCGADGVWHEVWLADDAPKAAKVGVLRRDFDQPMWGVARLKSYARGTSTWSKLPDVMIAKVAESLALRRAFPNELSGVYIPEEMEQAQAEAQEQIEREVCVNPVNDQANDRAPTPRQAPAPEALTLRSLYERSQQLGVDAKRWGEIKAAARSDLQQIAGALDQLEYTTRDTPATVSASSAPNAEPDSAPTADQLAEIEYLCLLLDMPEPSPDTRKQAELNLRSLRKKAREQGKIDEAGREIVESASSPAEDEPIEHDLHALGTGKAARH